MKIKSLLALAALMALAIGADAQTPTKAPVKPPMKKSAPMKKPMKKSMPMRDPKTGRFMKKPSTTMMHTKTTKPGPMRDPKTGRFMKKKP